MEISRQVEELKEELVQLRRDFHQHPELGFEEFRTADRVEAYLCACGLEPRRVTRTGVVALLSGHVPGPTLLMRADMDALPVQEENEVPYRSEYPGKMHACGHDGHTAMLLVAARILSQKKDDFNGKILFVFQPNEENAGALPMIEEGLLAEYAPDACMGLHLWPALETGTIGVSAGPVLAGMFQFRLQITGKSGHTGYPHQAVDPILCAANVVQSLQMIQTREISALEPTILIIGRISGGVASNIIADSVTLEGTARYLHEDGVGAQRDIAARLERIVADLCHAHRTEYEFTVLSGSPTVVNDATLAEQVRSVAATVVGGEQHVTRVLSPVGEDFSEFSNRIPGVFYFVGAGNAAKGACFPHHHSRFQIDEDALPIGVEMHVRTALEYLGSSGTALVHA
jgi:amidohydrolase